MHWIVVVDNCLTIFLWRQSNRPDLDVINKESAVFVSVNILIVAENGLNSSDVLMRLDDKLFVQYQIVPSVVGYSGKEGEMIRSLFLSGYTVIHNGNADRT